MTILSSVNFYSFVTLAAFPLCPHKMGKKEDLGRYRPVSLPQFVGKLMNKSSSKTFKHMKKKFKFGNKQCEFSRGKSYPADPIAFYEMPVFVAK